MNKSAILIASLSGTVILSACVVEPARVRVRAPVVEVSEVVVSRPPPPPRYETVPPPPGPAEVFVWQPGHWRWEGNDYRWRHGHYERRPANAVAWIPHHWEARGGRWVFVPGHWAYR